MMRKQQSLLALVVLFYGAVDLLAVYAAPANGPIIVRGNKLYYAKTGERFIMKGLTYEYAVSDDLYAKYSKEAIAKSLKGLDFNTLRVYNINPEESYKDFMTDMAKLGVYVLVAASPDNDPYFGKYRYAPIRKDLGPNGKVSSAKNGVKTTDVEETCYPSLLLEYGKKIAKNFAQYDNTLGIILANEIMQMDLTAGACVKQYGADLKSWMRVNAKYMRVLPLAYAAADSAYAAKGVTKPLVPEEYHVVKLQGLLCGDLMKDGMMTKSIDIYLINEYRWGNKGTYEATYGKFLQVVSGLPIVVGFGEYGAFGAEPRTWPMIPYLMQESKKTMGFSNVFSGGVAYSFGEAKLDKNSKFPMFTGGSSAFDGQPSYIEQPDYSNLKAQFAKYQAYSDPAEWDGSGKCKWAPTVTESIDPTNTRATKNGWIIEKCDDPALKLADTDTWIAKTRDGMVCDDQGGRCDVPITSRLGTTQEDICGGVVDIESGGGACESSSDCGLHGKCVPVNDVKQCTCQACYSGITCDTKNPSCSAKLTSSKDAPKLIAIFVSIFLGIMSVVFVTLGVIAHKQKRAMNKHGDQVKLGSGSVQVPNSL